MCGSVKDFFSFSRKMGEFYIILTSFDRFLMFLAKTTKTILCKLTFYSGLLHQCTTILNLFLNAFNDNLYWQEGILYHFRKFSWKGLWGFWINADHSYPWCIHSNYILNHASFVNLWHINDLSREYRGKQKSFSCRRKTLLISSILFLFKIRQIPSWLQHSIHINQFLCLKIQNYITHQCQSCVTGIHKSSGY